MVSAHGGARDRGEAGDRHVSAPIERTMQEHRLGAVVMSAVIDPPEPVIPVLPSIGVWWPMLETPLQLEILEHPTAPLRPVVVRRIFELCELVPRPVPRSGVRLGPNERAYLAGWVHAVDWS